MTNGWVVRQFDCGGANLAHVQPAWRSVVDQFEHPLPGI
jgi:hypothetical protein